MTKGYKKFECFDCGSEEFNVEEISDFPFFQIVCAKCNSIRIILKE